MPVSSIGILPEPSGLGLPERFESWRPGQEDAALRAVESTKRFVVLALPTGCVVGDTIVQVNRAKNSIQRTIEQEFYCQQNHINRRARGILPFTRSFDGKEIRLHEFSSVGYSGRRETVLLTLRDGKSLRATPDHQVLTSRGFVCIEDLVSTDEVICDTPRPRSNGKKHHKAQYRQIQGLKNHPYAGNSGSYRHRGNHVEGRLYRVPYHCIVVEANLNGLFIDEFIEVCRRGNTKGLTFLDPEIFAVHHRDEDSSHNDLDNLQVLTHEAHQKLHGDHTSFHQGIPKEVRVSWVKRAQISEEVYDLIACEPHENFVANGMVVHNSGKSLAYLAAAQLSGERTAFLTSTRGLQNQLEKDFGDSGLLDVRGQNNYPCLYKANGRTITLRDVQTDFADEIKCDEGPCHGGVRCELKESGCVYFDRVKLARQVTLVSTNYSYWMHQMEHGGGLGAFGMLVLDEAHDALDQLSNYLAVELFPSDLELVDEDRFPELINFEPWKLTARVWLDRARSQREDLEAAVKGGLANNGDSRWAVHQAKHLKKLERKLAQLSSAQGDWVFQVTRRGPSGSLVARFDPVWPADYAERRLFCGIKRVVLTSATIRPKTLELLGIGHGDVDFREYPSSFPVGRRPVYFVPSVRMDKRATPGHLRAWISKIDAIVRPRLQGKGIIHAVSYQRAQWIARNSEFAEHMLVHTRESSQDTIRRFKGTKAPAILVSPSVSTGFDFPDSECRWQILCKVPFPDTRDLVTKARSDRDRDYPMYQAMQEIVQMAGRSTRSEDDWSEVLVVDDHFEWFWPKFKKFAPKWFAEAVEICKVIPKPLEK